MLLAPESLITERFRPNPLQKKALTKLGLKTVADLLRYLPSRYGSAGTARKIAELKVGDEAVIYAKVLKNQTKKAFKKHIPMAEALVEDETGKIKIIWFHQAYLAKKAPAGTGAYFRGKVTERKGELYLANPEIDAAGIPAKKVAAGESLFVSSEESEQPTPVYPETRGLSSGWFHHHLKTILSEGVHEQLVDPLPEGILTKFNLPKLSSALVWAHNPKRREDAEAARKRFAFEEIFIIQLARLKDRAAYQAAGAKQIDLPLNKLDEFLKRFPFPLTGAQTRAINEILADFKLGRPMTRLLEGDVGSGKTAVAAATAYAVVQAGAEVGYMAPTEILAKQHFESFINYFRHLPINVGLITGSGCYKFPSKTNVGGFTNISRPQLLKWVANGEIPILIGTHALIQKTVKWKNLAYVIIDEQHRFGLMQRAKLTKKNESLVPHLLSMTATPIPRTLALTIYGDLDLSLLDELPAGRKNIITQIIPPSEAERQKVYEALRKEIKAGRQAYVICPRIDEPDPDKATALQTKSAKAELKKLGERIFPEFMVGLVHSKMKPTDKEEVMRDFTAGKIDILVATSVVEVGVNVPNATSIIIEGAERFGLAQLHQLRGRVFRSSHQAYCYLFTETKSDTSLTRLKSLVNAKNGFELAEMDLALRGAGALSGGKQWGISDLGMEAIKNLKLVSAARESAQKLVASDPNLTSHPEIQKILATRARTLHFE
jgi:ATP-dependent DNA helicase RecG